MPTAVAMLVEFSPPGHRQRTASYSFVGVGLGGMGAGLLGACLLPNLSFRAMFAVGIVALLIIPVFVKIFPESPSFLMSIGQEVRAREIARRYCITDLEIGHALQKGQPLSASDRLRAIFRGKRAVVTVLFCLVVMLVQTTATLAGYWIPALMRSGGYSIGSALLMVTVLYTGFVLGTLVTARMADRVGSRKVIVTGLLIAAASYSCLRFRLDASAGYLLVALIGMGGPGMQTLTSTFVASYYPAALRGTGIGVAIGVGRVGAILGPLYGGAVAARYGHKAEIPTGQWNRRLPSVEAHRRLSHGCLPARFGRRKRRYLRRLHRAINDVEPNFGSHRHRSQVLVRGQKFSQGDLGKRPEQIQIADTPQIQRLVQRSLRKI